jgi:uncharacterized protein
MTTAPVAGVSDTPVTATRSGIGHALPLGAAGFAWCSLTLGLSTVGVLSAAGSSMILPGTFFYGGIVQLVAAFFALAAGATFAAAFMGAYGAFWLGYSAINVWVAPHIVAEVMASKAAAPQVLAAQAGHDVAQALGVFLVGWLVVTVIFTIASLGTNAATVTAFLLLDLTIVLLMIAYLGATSAGAAQSGALHAAGYAEIVLAAVAFYIVLAELANETLGKAIFPLFPIKRLASSGGAA